MDGEDFFWVALLLLFAGFAFHRGYYTRKYAEMFQTISEQSEVGAFERFANLLALPGILAVTAYIANPAWMDWAQVNLPIWLRVAGIGLALSGFGLLQWSQITLGENWSDDPRIREGHHLVTIGPYKRIRHPIYTAFLLIMAAPFFISANWFIGLTWFGMTAINVAFRVRTEERMLVEEFGDLYSEYARTTGRLLPRVI